MREQTGDKHVETEQEPVRETLSSHVHQLEGSPQSEAAPPKDEFFVFQRELVSGTKLEHYEIDHVLGNGGFGITYLARDIYLNRYVVVKENFPSSYSHRDPLSGLIVPNNQHDIENYNWALRNFLNEARTIAELDHPGIVKILSIFETNGTAYFAMEYINGLSLDYLGDRLMTTGKRYTEDEMKGLLFRLLDILHYLHGKDIFHRDIKPGNILLTREGMPILIDFGAARHASKLTSLTVLTTHGYSSPEQALGLSNIGAWSDLYSLGATFYALLTGNPPERAEVRLSADTMVPLHTMPELAACYTQEFLQSIDKALMPQVEDRYANAAQWMESLHLTGNDDLSTINVSHEELRIAREKNNWLPLISTDSHQRQSDTEHSRKTTSRSGAKLRPSFSSIFTGVLIVLIIAVSVFIGADIFKKEPLGTTIKETISTIRLDTPREMLNLSAISIPTLSIPPDSPSLPKSIDSFRLKLSDTVLAQSNLPTPRPETLRISSIYLNKAANKPDSLKSLKMDQPLYLVIQDSAGNVVAQSDNAAQMGLVPGRLTVNYVFPALPELKTEEIYTYSFQTVNGEQMPVLLSMMDNGFVSKEQIPSYPHIKFICASPSAGPDPAIKTIAEEEVFRTLSQPCADSQTSISLLPSTSESLTLIKTMAAIGYPEAQYKMFLILSGESESETTLLEGIKWLYKSAVSGYPVAQRRLGSLLLGEKRFYPGLPVRTTLIPQDYAQAASFLRLATQHHDSYALYMLGLMNTQGWGTPRSLEIGQAMLEWASRTNPLFKTGHLDPTADIIGFWGTQYVKPNTPTVMSFPLTSKQALSDGSLRILSTGGNSQCQISDVHITQNGKIISAIATPYSLFPGSLPQTINIKIPQLDNYENLALAMTIKTPGTSIGAVQLLPATPDTAQQALPTNSTENR
ncbi:protein kinase [Akkermansia sp. N21169]|jgi:serine/threonine protein kinase|uniref:protein kinase domain-containing protein n=1 Tax=Akkermansia sp. N21169 TaxID=3040765 RepID=UPI00244E97BE|nr:protein kinase [Akkermansia sp. N21169]MDH3068996.1 protein kinase [Akkermansia sp. N21169]